MEGLQTLHLVIDAGVFRVPFRALGLDASDAVFDGSSGDKPAALHQHAQNVTAQGAQTVGVLQASEEQITFVGEAPAQFFSVVEGVVGDAQLGDGSSDHDT